MLALLLASAGCHAAGAGGVGHLAAGYRFPPLSGRVVDEANLLQPAAEERISRQSAALEAATGHQLVVVTLTSLGGHTIEDYGRNLGNYWGIGRKIFNDGVLLIVAPRERKVRIEVGCGLEKTLTNQEAAGILQHDVLPRLRKGQMADGIAIGVTDIIHEISPPIRKAA